MKKKSFVYPVVFMVLVTAVFTLVLSFLNQTSKAAIELNKKVELHRKILYVFDMYDETDSVEEVSKKFEENIEEKKYKEDKIVYVLKEGNETKAYAVPFDGPGLWGSIDGYIGVDKDLKHLTGIEFINQSETPGLGGRIGEAPYKEQFRNVDITNKVGDEIIVNRPAPGGNIDAIAGATQTSTFVKNMLNQDLIEFISGGGVE